MIVPDMCCKIIYIVKKKTPLVTEFAFKLFLFLCVSEWCVSSKITALRKRLKTGVTPIRFLSRFCSWMFRQISIDREWFQTDITFIRLLSRMNTHVFLPITNAKEGYHSNIAFIRLVKIRRLHTSSVPAKKNRTYRFRPA